MTFRRSALSVDYDLFNARGLADMLWEQGMHDNRALLRHRFGLKAIGDYTHGTNWKPVEVDYNEMWFTIKYAKENAAGIRFEFSRLHGQTKTLLLPPNEYPQGEGRVSVATVKIAFEWLKEQKEVLEDACVDNEVSTPESLPSS